MTTRRAALSHSPHLPPESSPSLSLPKASPKLKDTPSGHILGVGELNRRDDVAAHIPRLSGVAQQDFGGGTALAPAQHIHLGMRFAYGKTGAEGQLTYHFTNAWPCRTCAVQYDFEGGTAFAPAQHTDQWLCLRLEMLARLLCRSAYQDTLVDGSRMPSKSPVHITLLPP